MTRIVFMGTPEFAVPSLDALIDAGYDVAGAFTQPDRPTGRGHKLAACPVKTRALERGIDVYQFERVRGQRGLDTMRALKPDVIVTAAFGQILSKKLLEVPEMGTINVHASLLPKYRGAAPINWCIVMGEKFSGVTTMLTDAGVDTGDMLLSRKTPIGDMETAGELTSRLAKIGAELLIETLDGYLKGRVLPIKQDESLMSHQPMLDKEMGRVDWSRAADEIACQVRGLNPWPCAFTSMDGGILKIYLAKPLEGDFGVPGKVVEASAKKGLIIACGRGGLEVIEMQAPNAKRMAARAYLMGKKIDVGTILGCEKFAENEDK